MSGYVVPGGSTVQPALVAYRPVSLTANTTLVWPAQSQSPTDFAARVMNVTSSAGPFNLTLPPATQVSTGFDLIIVNVGSNNFNVNSNTGVTLATITPGQVYYFNLTDNTTAGGTWYSFLFGAGSSSLSAAAIAGFGLIATGATLSQNRVVNTTSASPINIAASDRASVYVWQGGGGTVNLPAVSTLTNGFFFSLTNEGTGTLTITPNGADTIDANSSLTLQPNLSVTIFANQTSAWFTVGRVPSQQFNFTELVQTVTGGTFTETLTQAQNVVQRFIGTLTSNETVVFPNIVQIYYVQNATSGAFNVTFSAAGGGSSVNVPQGTNAILFSDGSNVINASNAQLTATTSISIASGSVTAPSLNFGAATTPDPTTGLYQTAQGRVDVTCLGVQQAEFSSTGLVLNNNATAKAFIPTGSTIPVNGMYLPAANTVGFAANSTEIASFTTAQGAIYGTSGGAVFTVGTPAHTNQFQFNATDAGAATLSFNDASTTIGNIGSGQNFPFGFLVNNSEAARFSTSKNLLINNTTDFGSGDKLQVTAQSDLTGIQISGSVNNVSLTLSNTGTGGVGSWRLSATDNASGFGGGLLVLGQASQRFMSWNSSGNTIISAPSSGVALTINGVSGSDTAVFVPAGSGDAATFNLNHASGNGILFKDTNGSPQNYRIGLGIGDGSTAFAIYDSTNAKIRAQITAAGATQVLPDNGATAYEVGFRDLIVNNQNANYTFALVDRGALVWHNNASAHTYTIPTHASVALNAGSIITIFNNSGAGVLSIAPAGGVTLRWAGTANTGTRSLAAVGSCTIYQLVSDTWIISGSGLS